MKSAFTVALFVALASCGGRSALEGADDEVATFAGSAGAPPLPLPVGGAGAATTGGSTSASGGAPSQGGSSAGSAGTGPLSPPPDANCTSDRAKGGMACAMACVTTCGFYGLGTRTCDCVSGVFVSCHCPRPWDYQGHTSAPICATPDGKTHWLDNTACTQEWQQCVGTDPYSGSNPRGCLCLTDPVNGKLEWTCGSTNRWFLAE